MVKLERETGSLAPRRQGNPGWGKLAGVKDWVRTRVAEQGELTLAVLAGEIGEVHGISRLRASVGRLLQRPDLTHKKTPVRG